MIELSTVVLGKDDDDDDDTDEKDDEEGPDAFPSQLAASIAAAGKIFHSNELRFRGRPCAYDSRFSDMEEAEA